MQPDQLHLMSTNKPLIERLPQVRGSYRADATLGKKTWFGTGGNAEILYKPADQDDLSTFLSLCPRDIPITVLGVCSNVIIRDGGLKGVVIRLGREFAHIDIDTDNQIVTVGAATLDLNVAKLSAAQGCAGLEFLSGIPGSIGGALRMNGGAYGTETADVLMDAVALDRSGTIHSLSPKDMGMSYRHNALPSDYIFTVARFKTHQEDARTIEQRIEDIRNKREETQPIREKTGGSTFANPDPQDLEKAGLPHDTKTWKLIDEVDGRGYRVGGAQMSEKHCNFMINTGTATAADLENLGEDIRKKVHERFGIMLRWEIKRIGEPLTI